MKHIAAHSTPAGVNGVPPAAQLAGMPPDVYRRLAAADKMMSPGRLVAGIASFPSGGTMATVRLALLSISATT